MFIFKSLSVGFISLCHIVSSSCFCLMRFSFCETENLYVSAMEHLKQREKNKTKSNFNKNEEKGVSSCMKKGVISVAEKTAKK